MENLGNPVDIKIICNWEAYKIHRLVASSSYARHEIFGSQLAEIHMHKTRLHLDKLIFTNMTILENGKMYDCFYNEIKA